ncbi:MAG: T9SS type A sorting domain-containing protein [Bacteroidetes bacterium]|nr:T9SS type A sorting domain-containing protein [Bacteroidota bacterium]
MFAPLKSFEQITLNANGPGSTYELINSVLAPGYTAVESPDQCNSHPSFGRHIAEVFDATLNKFVFEFYIHVPTSFPITTSTADNDRCISFDRQRVEIKTYESSPANLKGTIGETTTYKWKFKLPSGFQPSPNFTHIHQIKAVGGDDGDPLFTLTPRYGTTNAMQLLYYLDSNTSANVLTSVNLSSFLGTWVEATEVVNVGANGTYSINVKRVSDGLSLLSYSSSNIQTIRQSNSFIRPKWGIYRSLNSQSFLRDDSIRLSDISIQEGMLPVKLTSFNAAIINKKTVLNWMVENEVNLKQYEIEFSNNGVDFSNVGVLKAINTSSYSFEFSNLNERQYYRLKMIDNDGTFSYSNIISLFKKGNVELTVYPNPAKNYVTITTNNKNENTYLMITDAIGKLVKKMVVMSDTTNVNTSAFLNGMYHIQITKNNQLVCDYPLIIAK